MTLCLRLDLRTAIGSFIHLKKGLHLFFPLGLKSLPICKGHHDIHIPIKGKYGQTKLKANYVLKDNRTTNVMGLFPNCSPDSSDRYNNVTNNTGQRLNPCPWWQIITHNAVTVLILCLQFSCL